VWSDHDYGVRYSGLIIPEREGWLKGGRFPNLYLKAKGPIFQRMGVAKVYLGQCDMGREAQCELHGVAQIEVRKARRGSWDVRAVQDAEARRECSAGCEGLPFGGLWMRA
jgi:hypothetical protein